MSNHFRSSLTLEVETETSPQKRSIVVAVATSDFAFIIYIDYIL